MKKNEFSILYSIKKNGLANVRKLASACKLSTGLVSGTLKSFREKGLIDDNGITDKGIDALSPYKVDNAIIMAAGMSSRFLPLSLEKPKGLLIVKNQVLIERQIEQLKEAGINDIILVLGYKKESFFYLEDKYNLKIVINPLFNVKNNIETLYLAQKYIGNSYICSSDDYFAENVFDEYVYQSYYSAIHVKEKTNEWYMEPDSGFNVKKVLKSGDDGFIMLGHAYWSRDFSQKFIELINKHHDIGDYDSNLWEDLFADNIAKLPKVQIKEYPDKTIYEFDSLDELKKFDFYYTHNSNSKIMRNICSVLRCREKDITNFKLINKGLTNISFIFEVKGRKYIYRHPGEGTENIISRKHEKIALRNAKSLRIDPTFIDMDDKTGWKISQYIDNARMPDYGSWDDSKKIIGVMKRLHGEKLSVGWEFLPWDEACKIEKMLAKKDGINIPDFKEIKANVEKCYKQTANDGVERIFCHCDTYAPNWMLTDDQTILIDWEYAGNADPGCDVGGYIMDAMYSIEEATAFIKEYCGDDFNEALLFHYMTYVALISYYWFVWALYRESCGANTGSSLHNWYVMAKRFSGYLQKIPV